MFGKKWQMYHDKNFDNIVCLGFINEAVVIRGYRIRYNQMDKENLDHQWRRHGSWLTFLFSFSCTTWLAGSWVPDQDRTWAQGSESAEF